jgi:hypothetical protein
MSWNTVNIDRHSFYLFLSSSFLFSCLDGRKRLFCSNLFGFACFGEIARFWRIESSRAEEFIQSWALVSKSVFVQGLNLIQS